jgi:hypothetical protein
MAFEHMYDMCMRATNNDEHYCKQILNELNRLARERMVRYRDERGIEHVVVLPTDDEPLVEIKAERDKSLDVKVKGGNYVAFVKYIYDGQIRPVYAMLSTPQHVYTLNIYMSSKDIQREIFARKRGYGR